MELLIKPRNLEINERTRAYIQKKFAPMGRRLRGVGEVKVEVRREPTRSAQDQVIVQVTVNVNGTLLRAEDRAASVNAAVDVVAHALDRQVLKYKGRRFRSFNRRKSGPGASIRSQEMEEAALQMELLGHHFFLFLNGATQQYSVLYRRNDGDYGIIEPELA